jgi:hypothetical protein
MKNLYTQPFRPLDRQQHQQMVDTYLSLLARAEGAGVTIDPPLQVAGQAFSSSHFQLAKVAIEQAYMSATFDPATDRDVTRAAVSTLFGIGRYYTTTERGSPLYEDGLAALVASDIIADHYQTGQSEAEALLYELGYTYKDLWPAPLDTPLLP